MAHAKDHDYHILNPSVWPLHWRALGGLYHAVWRGAVDAHPVRSDPVSGPCVWIGFTVVFCTSCSHGGRDVVNESHIGDHTPVVADRPALWLYPVHVMSEVMFFAAWFWSFFQTRDLSDGRIFGQRICPTRV